MPSADVPLAPTTMATMIMTMDLPLLMTTPLTTSSESAVVRTLTDHYVKLAVRTATCLGLRMTRISGCLTRLLADVCLNRELLKATPTATMFAQATPLAFAMVVTTASGAGQMMTPSSGILLKPHAAANLFKKTGALAMTVVPFMMATAALTAPHASGHGPQLRIGTLTELLAVARESQRLSLVTSALAQMMASVDLTAKSAAGLGNHLTPKVLRDILPTADVKSGGENEFIIQSGLFRQYSLKIKKK